MADQSPVVPDPLPPDWLAHRYDPARDAVHFLPVDRAMRLSVPFLTDEYLPPSQPTVLRREDSLRLAPAAAPLHFILHSAFCCSTLLTKGLDRPRLATAFSEPVFLNDIVGWRRRGAPPPEVAKGLDAALALLSRPFEDGEAAIIKPSNIVNGLASAILGMRPDARALLLYAPLRGFLTSVAKKGLDGRLWVRELFLGLRTDGLVQRLGFDDHAFFGQTDLQIAAAGWLAQQALFADMLAGAATADRLRSLDSEQLLENPDRALGALGSLFGLDLDRDTVSEIVAGPFRRNAKSGASFDRTDRDREYEAAASAHADEIDKVARWAEVVAEQAGIPMRLPSPLI